MNDIKTTKKAIDKNFAVSLISGIFAFLSLLVAILDLSVPLHNKYKWAIFSVFSIICIYFARRFFSSTNSSTIKNTYSTFEVLSPDSNVSKYITACYSSKHTNRVHIHGGKFTLDLTAANTTEMTGTPLINQAIHWTLDATNVDKIPLTSYNFSISLSAFTSWQDGSISISARLITPKNQQIYDIRRITCPPVKDTEDVRFLNFKFPDGVQCNRGEMFTLEIHMYWTRGCHFKSIETYFSDPSNYGSKVDEFIIEINTDTDNIMSRNFILYRVNKSTRLLVPYSQATKDLFARKIHWSLSPNMDEIYLVRISSAMPDTQGHPAPY